MITEGESDTKTLWQREVLKDLVSGLTELSNSEDPSSVASRIHKKFQLWNITSTPSQEWISAIESIASVKDFPAYVGPQIKPQFGLVPIGKDPKSGFFEFVNLDTGIAPKRDSDGKIVIKDDMGLVMVLVPGGKFWMGAQKKNPASPNYDPKAFEIESPVHEVTLAPFFISKYEMFEFQWSRLATANSRNHDEQDRVANLPIDNISWDDCSECLPAAGLQLPTESQWEYAARGGTSTPWWTGSDEKLIEKGGNVLRPNAHRIGSFLGNPFGLHDTIGNVFEWCQDGETTYETVVRAGDGLRATARSDHRVIRGCSFLSGVGNARSALRSFDRPTHRINQLGVRPARAITQ